MESIGMNDIMKEAVDPRVKKHLMMLYPERYGYQKDVEVWAVIHLPPIKQNMYEVSNFGKVRKIDKKEELSISFSDNYPTVNLQFDLTNRRTGPVAVRNLVAHVFCQDTKKTEYDKVKFVDNDCNNLHASNLKWYTPGDNYTEDPEKYKYERWKPLVYRDVRKGMYEISDHGRVRNIYTGYTTTGSKSKKYLNVKLRNEDNTSQKRPVHRLVAVHFIEDLDHLDLTVNHEDGDHENNHYMNLSWMTIESNRHHAIKNNLRDVASHRKMDDGVIHYICQLLLKYYGKPGDVYRQLTEENIDIPLRRIKQIKSKETWSHISDQYFTKEYMDQMSIKKVSVIIDTLIANNNDVSKTFYDLQERFPYLTKENIRLIKSNNKL